MILTVKLILSPLIIAVISLAGRRWGSTVSGWFLGFPLTSAPITLVMALQHGTDFAAASAAGNLGGQASVCVFCLVYSYAALQFNWMVSAAFGITAFFASIIILNQFNLTLLPAFFSDSSNHRHCFLASSPFRWRIQEYCSSSMGSPIEDAAGDGVCIRDYQLCRCSWTTAQWTDCPIPGIRVDHVYLHP
ncbi:hypothetical protein [Leptolinea tardivitalis]|uniref:Uncharacterized protein n=1 Tax=Leptolinea tardivitalis TaxID=229920 RepID=A0A0P6XEH8_9CHLR|nr:hypothetical protein [Leptolinea tardivitalis]KPL73244.1 hypothetical protein ADM99_03165 [Leptolinea tardivitalis]GAP21359.1 hypothetical protein LTAR_01570 [Leptolinea tardivitalis]